jgi:hypothetical protein
MIKHIWSVLCNRSVIDSETNNLSLFDVFEDLNVSVKPNSPSEISGETINKNISIPIKYEVVSMWLKDKDIKVATGTMQIELIDPIGKSLKSFSHNLEIKEIHNRIRSRIKVTGIELTVSGTYIFNIKLKEGDKENFRTVVEVPLAVKIIKKDNQKAKTTN